MEAIEAVGHLVKIETDFSYPFCVHFRPQGQSWIGPGDDDAALLGCLPGMLVSSPGKLQAGPFEMQDANTSIDSL